MNKTQAVCLALFSALLTAPTAFAGQSATVHSDATLGTATQSHGAAAFGQRTAAAPLSKGVRRTPRSSAATQSAAPAPRATPSSVAAAPELLANFNGTSSRDSGDTNFGQEFEPPDSAMCAGNGFVISMVNSAYTVYRPNGSVVTGPFNINGPFNEGLLEFTTDPRCHYDAATGTWFATIAFISVDATESHVDIAVNPSGDPTKIWTNYQIDTTNGPGHKGCPCFGDQPLLGIDAYNLYVSTNDFSILGPEFNGAQIYAISKKELVGLSRAPHFVHYDKLFIGGAQAASVQPALTTGNPDAEFFLNSLDPTATFDQRIGVWALTNRSQIANGVKPKLSSLVLDSQAYGLPPDAEQKGSSSPIATEDDRMQQTQYIGGNVWGELTTAITIPNDPVERSGAAWFKVKPVLSGSVIGAATKIAGQGYLAVRDTYLMFPALQAAPNGNAAMVVSLSSASRYPSAGYSLMPKGASQFGPVRVAAGGTGPYDPDATRWGDYSWAVLDPSGESVWMTTEYIPPKSRQTQDRRRNWGTRVFDVSVK